MKDKDNAYHCHPYPPNSWTLNIETLVINYGNTGWKLVCTISKKINSSKTKRPIPSHLGEFSSLNELSHGNKYQR